MSARLGQSGAAAAVAAAAILLFLALAVRQSGKPLQLDAVDVPLVARSIAAGDGPELERGLQEGTWNGLIHSPLLAYLLGGAFAAIGATARVAQLFGAAATVACALLTAGIARTLGGERAGRLAALVLVPLYLLQPFTLQVSAVPSAASALAPPLLAALLLAAARLGWRAGEPRAEPPSRVALAAPSALLALLLWTGPYEASLGLLAAAALPSSWGWRRAARYWMTSLLAAVEAYVVSSMAVEVVSGADFSAAVESLARAAPELLGRLSSGGFATHLAVSVPFHLRWTGLFPWVALAAAVAGRPVGETGGERALRRLFALTALVAALVLATSSGTYATAPFLALAPLHALTMLPAALLVRPGAEGAGRRVDRAVAFAVGLTALVLGVATVGERVLEHGNRTGASLQPHVWALWLPGLVAALALALPRRISTEARRRLLLLALVSHLGVQFGVAIVQSGASHSTSYNYGQSGLGEAIAHVRAEASGEDGLLCMKDVAFGLERPFWDSLPAFRDDPGEEATIRLLERGTIRFAVFTTRLGQDALPQRPRLAGWLESHALGSRRFDDYVVWELRRPPREDGR